MAHPRRERNRGRHRRAGRAALRPRQERLLVRIAALDRGDPAYRALPERHGYAGVVGGARRHGVGVGKSQRRHRRGRRDGLPPLPRNPDAVSRPGQRLLYRLDAADRPAGPVPGRHRYLRSLAIQERAGTLKPASRSGCANAHPESVGNYRLAIFRHREDRFLSRGVIPSRSQYPCEAVIMRAIFAIVLSAIALAGCNQDNDVTGSVANCARELYTPYNPKDMKLSL